MLKFNKYKLSEIVNIIGGGTPKTSNPEYWGGEIPWLSVVDFAGDRKKVYSTEKTITEKGLKESSTKLLKQGQLIISARGTVGELAVLSKDMAFNQSCYGLDAIPGKTNNNFIYYLLKYKLESLKAVTHGSVFDTITRQTFEQLEVEIPESIEAQNRISEIFSAFDDKIELNRRMNQTLEQMAQTFFQKYFVKNLVDDLPEGWRLGKLQEVTERITKGTTPTTLKRPFVNSGINFIKVESLNDLGEIDVNKINYIDEETDQLLQRSRIQDNDILFSIAGTLGRIAIINSDILPANTNQALAIIRPDSTVIEPLFIYYWLKLDNVREALFTRTVQAVQANLSLGVLSETDILIPSKDFLKSAFENINLIHNKIIQNQRETRTLINLRDTLLPKLMSGEIDVMQTKAEELYEPVLS